MAIRYETMHSTESMASTLSPPMSVKPVVGMSPGQALLVKAVAGAAAVSTHSMQRRIAIRLTHRTK
jgi:hypothetical protein